MRSAYRVLAYAIAVEVLVQAAAIAYAVAGLGKWVADDHGVLTKKVLDSSTSEFTGEGGFALHGINGQMLIPLLALALLVVSLRAQVAGGVRMAAIIFGLVVIQVALGFAATSVPALGALHGLLALLLFGAALMTGIRAPRTAEPVAS
jgi:hypothetical protein